MGMGPPHTHTSGEYTINKDTEDHTADLRATWAERWPQKRGRGRTGSRPAAGDLVSPNLTRRGSPCVGRGAWPGAGSCGRWSHLPVAALCSCRLASWPTAPHTHTPVWHLHVATGLVCTLYIRTCGYNYPVLAHVHVATGDSHTLDAVATSQCSSAQSEN